VLMGLREDDLETKSRLAKLRQELERLGWSEGSNLHMDIRFAPAGDQGSALAKELVALRPEVMLAHTGQATGALHGETRVIPIVFVNVSDPVGAGFVSNLARPDGNLTGLLQYEQGIIGKWLSFLKEIAPTLVRVALVADPRSPIYGYFVRNAKAAAASLALELVPTPVENDGDIERSLDTFARQPDSGLLLPPDATTLTSRMAVCFCRRTPRPSLIAISSSHSRPATAYRQCTLFVCSSLQAVSCTTGPTSSTCLGAPPLTSTAYCAARDPPTYRCRCRPSTKPCSTSGPRRRSGSACHRACLWQPTK
jgi:ABC transporter substrate binding protein